METFEYWQVRQGKTGSRLIGNFQDENVAKEIASRSKSCWIKKMTVVLFNDSNEFDGCSNTKVW